MRVKVYKEGHGSDVRIGFLTRKRKKPDPSRRGAGPSSHNAERVGYVSRITHAASVAATSSSTTTSSRRAAASCSSALSLRRSGSRIMLRRGANG